jgi:hypothetical protein
VGTELPAANIELKREDTEEFVVGRIQQSEAREEWQSSMVLLGRIPGKFQVCYTLDKCGHGQMRTRTNAYKNTKGLD